MRQIELGFFFHLYFFIYIKHPIRCSIIQTNLEIFFHVLRGHILDKDPITYLMRHLFRKHPNKCVPTNRFCFSVLCDVMPGCMIMKVMINVKWYWSGSP